MIISSFSGQWFDRSIWKCNFGNRWKDIAWYRLSIEAILSSFGSICLITIFSISSQWTLRDPHLNVSEWSSWKSNTDMNANSSEILGKLLVEIWLIMIPSRNSLPNCMPLYIFGEVSSYFFTKVFCFFVNSRNNIRVNNRKREYGKTVITKLDQIKS